MIPTNKMKRSKDGFVWDPDAWRTNTKERRRLEEGNVQVKETEYELAVARWHLKGNMEKSFGQKPWMRGMVDPDTLEWDANGNRVRPPAVRTLNETQPTQKRSLR